MTEKLRIILYTTVIALFAAAVHPLCGTTDDDLATLRKKAGAGDAQAQFDLGLRYQQGNDVGKDPAEAVSWYRKAAERGLPVAQLQLGICYIKGEGVPEDLGKGIEWCRRSAEGGLPLAQYLLGLMLSGGKEAGIETNRAEALKWMEKAAEKGFPEAQFSLFVLMGKDGGEPAMAWLNKSAEKGFAPAQLTLALFLMEAPRSEADVSAGIKLARACLEDPTKLKPESSIPIPDNLVEGFQNQVHLVEGLLALRYYLGAGVEKDTKEAFRWARRAVDGGCGDDPRLLLATLYINGEGVERNFAKALELFRPLADRGNAKAQMAVGEICHQGGDGVMRNDRIALDYCLKAAAQGQVAAQYRAGMIYLAGGEPGVKPDVNEGLRRIRDAAEKGLMEAEYSYGTALLQGIGGTPNCGKAREWYLKAAEQGDANAMCNLGVMAMGAFGCPADDRESESWLRKALAANPEDDKVYYNMACLYSRRKQTETALDWLRKALEKGYRDLKSIREDPDLETIRGLPEFKTLMSKYFP